MSRCVEHRQGAGDRAGSEHERNREREREAEDEREDEQGERQSDRFPAAQVGGELRIEVVLDRGLAGDEGSGADRAAKVVAVCLGLLQAQVRLQLAVDDSSAAAHDAYAAPGKDVGRSLECCVDPPLHVLVRRMPNGKHDGERPLRSKAEVVCQHGVGPVGVRPGHRERVRELRRQEHATRRRRRPRPRPSRSGRASGSGARAASSWPSNDEEERAAAPPGARPAARRSEKSKSTISPPRAPSAGKGVAFPGGDPLPT